MRLETVHPRPDGARIETDEGPLRLQVFDDDVIRVAHAPEEVPDAGSPMVIAEPGETEWDLNETDETVELATDELRMEVRRDSGALTWRDAAGRRLGGEPDSGGKSVTPVDPRDLSPGETEPASPVSLDRVAYSTRLDLRFADDEAILGLGQHEGGVANYRGESQQLYQANTKVAMPAILSTRGYGVLWDTGSVATFHDDQHGTFFWTECADALEFYVVYGPDPDGVISGFRSLTGEATMLPKWAYGYVQSKERYASQRELLDVVGEYRDRGLPLDCVVQDWQYWPDSTPEDPDFAEWDGPPGDWGRWGEKRFHPERYPDPAGMLDDLHDLGARLMISVWPNALAGEDHDELRAAGHLLDDAGVSAPENEQCYYDAFDPDARETYWRQAREGLFDHGIDAWWCDSTEPYDPDWTLPTEPDPARRGQHATDALKSVLDPGYVNTYSLHHARGIYEGQRRVTEEKRVLNLTRSGYPGQQRYGAITWSGDVEATWECFENQIADGLQFTATGNPKWTLDVGGFFVNGGYPWTDAAYEAGHEDAGYRELYVRWFQYGTFLPMLRSHGTDTPREVWRFGEPGDRTYDTLVRFLRLRYRLLPYLYTLAGWETHRDYTTYRHLALEFPDDESAHGIGDQFLCGPALMACPVTEPMYYGPGSTPLEGRAKAREVYLPGDAEWYDFWTGERHAGGRTVLADAPLEKLPLFVRAGSVLPMGPTVQHTGEKPDADWELRVYPGTEGSFDLYEDAGDGYDYEDGDYAFTPIRWDDAAGELRFGEREGGFPELLEERTFRIVGVGEGRGVGVGESEPHAELRYDGSPSSVRIRRR